MEYLTCRCSIFKIYHRFAMHELGLSSRKPYKKCARVVGEVLGKFHPHGDSAVYDALVRMAQDFSMRCPLVRGHGNFGSVDADPPAAMRYTECRLEALTEAMLLADLEQDTVDFDPNFDNSQKEPSVLPARIPTLLLNGSSGIAVGMATNIPPHNLGELVDALSVLIHNPEATLQELLEYMPGPDFPTGGLIMGNIGILEAYRTGRGRIIVRGKTDIELLDSKTKRSAIIIKEIPYQTNKSALVEKIAELVEDKILEGISDIRDESDRTGMRIVIELKRGSDPSIVLNNLYRLTALQSSFSCNMVGILDRQPKQMGLKELLQAFLDFRCSVIERRAKFKLSQAQDRKHIVEGIITGLENVDGVIRIIRESSSNAMASAALRNAYDLSEKQADALLDMTLRKLTLLETKKFVDEAKHLTEEISKLSELLSSKKQIFQLIEQEANEIKNKFPTPRRSMLEDSDSGQLDEIDVIPNEEMLLTLSEKGYLKRMKPNTFNLQNRGTIGKSVGKMRVNDAMSDFLVCHSHDHVLYFSDRGIVYSARAYKVPECTRTAAGTPLVQILSLSDGERITSIIPVSELSGDQYLVMLTVNGYIKKVSLSFFSAIRSTGIIAIQLVPGDELKWVRLCTDDDLVAMASQNGMVILSFCDTLRTLGRNTRGSVAMRLKNGDKMACMDIIPAAMRKDLERASENHQNRGKDLSAPWLLFVSESGLGKRVPLSSFRLSPRNRVGLKGYKLVEDRLAAVFVVGLSLAEDGESDEQVVLVSQSGTINRIKVRDVSIQSRYARGVILMRLEHAGKIQSTSLISAVEEEAEAERVENAAELPTEKSATSATQ
ncbi:DNA topoisomerase [Macleaya cordata]|uniref:DNA topoisomerase (ATP-hydrolyzing) n=1 Tax=Macleaya cordata TaxID=56857 RepID=A0A200QXK2_MACCD|nr:DNA topoisomerase [Macleaya cordata]